MTTYTATFRTEAYWADEDIEAETPELALEKACAVAKADGGVALDWQGYDDIGAIDEIEIINMDVEDVYWQSADFRLRLAASDMLEALELAVSALNQAPRLGFRSLIWTAIKSRRVAMLPSKKRRDNFLV